MPQLVSKFFRAAAEGDTVDGREISRRYIQEIADNYDPKLYTAEVWLEHIRGLFPDSQFKSLGEVTECKAEEVTEGDLKGKLALYVKIKPHPDLIKMQKDGQKTRPSIEIHPTFSKEKGAYLMGLGATNSPASKATEVMQYCAKQNADHLFSVALDELSMEFEEVTEPEKFSDKLKKLFSKSKSDNDDRFSDHEKSMNLIADELDEVKKDHALLSTQYKILDHLYEKLKNDFDSLSSDIDNYSTNNPIPRNNGGGGDTGGEERKKSSF